MKNLLLLLSALIFAAPAFAADTAGAASAVPSASAAPEKATQPDTAKKAKKTKKAKKKTAPKKKAEATATEGVAPMGCPTGCQTMNCPPPGGPVRCCNTATYTPC